MTDIHDNDDYVPEQEEEVVENLDTEVSQEPEEREQPFDENQTEKESDQGKRHKTRDTIKGLNRDVWQLLEENRVKDERLRQLEAEKAALSDQLQQSANITLNHYDNSANLRLDQAKQRLVAAEEIGDVSAKADAIAEISAATAEAQRAKEWKAQLSWKDQAYKEAAAAPAPAPVRVDERFGQTWVQNNSWYNPSSSEYQPLLAEPVRKYASQLDYSLVNSGQQHLIYSPQYFNDIEAYAQNVGESLLKNRGLNMQQGNNSVSSVNRNSAAGNSSKRTTIHLTPDQKRMAKNCGVSEETYSKYVAEEMNDKSIFGRNMEIAKRNGRF